MGAWDGRNFSSPLIYRNRQFQCRTADAWGHKSQDLPALLAKCSATHCRAELPWLLDLNGRCPGGTLLPELGSGGDPACSKAAPAPSGRDPRSGLVSAALTLALALPRRGAAPAQKEEATGRASVTLIIFFYPASSSPRRGCGAMLGGAAGRAQQPDELSAAARAAQRRGTLHPSPPRRIRMDAWSGGCAGHTGAPAHAPRRGSCGIRLQRGSSVRLNAGPKKPRQIAAAWRRGGRTAR